MSFSPYDFRFVISQPDPDPEKLRRSLLREPWTSLLTSWNYLQQPREYLWLFQHTIQEGIGTGRYSPTIVCPSVFNYPEFWIPTLNGLVQLWIHLPLNVRQGTLTIGKTPNSINLDPTDRLLLIDLLYIGKPVPIHVNGKDYVVGLWIHHSARHVWVSINQLSCIILNSHNQVKIGNVR